MLNVTDKNGRVHRMRAVLDTGGQDSFVTSFVTAGNNWHSAPTDVNIGNLNENPKEGSCSIRRFKMTVSGVSTGPQIDIYPLEVDNMAGIIYQPPIPPGLLQGIRRHQPLADPQAFSLKPGTLEFQLILGNDIVNAIFQEVIHRYTATSVIKSTLFGNLFSGAIPEQSELTRKTCMSLFVPQGRQVSQCVQVLNTVVSKTELEKEVSSVVRNFYEQEIHGLLQGDQTQEQADQLVLENFQKNLTRKADGRYIIKLPWKDNSLLPSENMQMAMCRLKGQQRKLQKQPQLAAQYSECLKNGRKWE